MKRKAYGRDAGLSLRMLLTTSMLGLLYVLFAVALFYVLNAGIVLMVVIVGGLAFVQYFTSDKLALRAAGAKVVERDEAPELHDMIERLCAMADLRKPRVAVIERFAPAKFFGPTARSSPDRAAPKPLGRKSTLLTLNRATSFLIVTRSPSGSVNVPDFPRRMTSPPKKVSAPPPPSRIVRSG